MRRRLVLVVPTVLGVVLLVGCLLRLLPGDPVEIMLGEAAGPTDARALRAALALDRPLPAQLAHFLGGVLRGDLGRSIAYREPVARVIAERYPATLELAAAALLLALVLGIPAGALAAARHGRGADLGARLASLVGICLPSLWLGPLLVLVFSVELGWLPVSGRGSLAHLVLPAVSLALGMAGLLVRLTRASMLEAMHDAHVLAARARGAPEWLVLGRHVLRNAAGPVVTVLGLQAGALLAGTVVTETIFAWPGVGRLLVQAIAARDYPLVQGCVLVIGGTYVAVNLLADWALVLLDPRVRDDA